ncbi:hypothetical protein FRC04_010083 [Tulasnella sp. 424]|nr:hypothetical protein FRC04_010083 [Tulasnella sp. 424]KAG8974106.1 hypothetical protein FRC05_007854 [Tulasnella sp. 425]
MTEYYVYVKTTYSSHHPPTWHPDAYSVLPFKPNPVIWSGFAITWSEHRLKDELHKSHFLPTFAETSWSANEPAIVLEQGKEGVPEGTPEFVPTEEDLEIIKAES